MNDTRLGELLRTNDALRRKFIKNILDAKQIVNRYKSYSEFDIDSEDLGMKNNLKKIKKVVRDLERNKALKEKNIDEFGRFDRLKQSVNLDLAKEYFEKQEGIELNKIQVNIRVDKFLRDFILNS